HFFCFSHKMAASPKTNQANGTHIPRESDSSQAAVEGTACEHMAAFLPSPFDSPQNSTDTTLDTTGDITVEDVKDMLG
ncbi:hypothetical protein FKM82_031361, partial [Ascaphus truei]